jgi:CBS domain-containing protein
MPSCTARRAQSKQISARREGGASGAARRKRPARRQSLHATGTPEYPRPGAGRADLGPKETAMLVSEILRIKGNALFTTAPEGSVFDAVKVMAQHDIGSLVVMDHGRMVGMLTFAEVLQALTTRQGQLGDLKVSDIQVRDPLTATTGLDVMELRRVMLERHARYVPVIDGPTLLGVVSFHDVAKAVYEEQSFENRMLKSYIKNWPDADEQ